MLAIAQRAATTLHGALPTLACAAGILLRADSIHHDKLRHPPSRGGEALQRGVDPLPRGPYCRLRGSARGFRDTFRRLQSRARHRRCMIWHARCVHAFRPATGRETPDYFISSSPSRARLLPGRRRREDRMDRLVEQAAEHGGTGARFLRDQPVGRSELRVRARAAQGGHRPHGGARQPAGERTPVAACVDGEPARDPAPAAERSAAAPGHHRGGRLGRQADAGSGVRGPGAQPQQRPVPCRGEGHAGQGCGREGAAGQARAVGQAAG